MSTWNQQMALTLCREVEAICPQSGCHVGLTGGLLYKAGDRKDCDLIFYRIRQRPSIDVKGLFAALESVGIFWERGGGWCWKCYYLDQSDSSFPLDIFFPEEHSHPDDLPYGDPDDKNIEPKPEPFNEEHLF